MRVESTYPPRALKERIAYLSGPARYLHFDIRYTTIQHEASFTCTSSPGRVFFGAGKEKARRGRAVVPLGVGEACGATPQMLVVCVIV